MQYQGPRASVAWVSAVIRRPRFALPWYYLGRWGSYSGSAVNP